MSGRKPLAVVPPPLPATDREILANQQILADLKGLVANLGSAPCCKLLHCAASRLRSRAAGEHFVELGRRYHKLLYAPQKLTLRVVEGGAA